MFVYLHNPRCSKSRAGLEVLNEKGIDFETREYLKNPLNKKELEDLSQKLELSPIDFIRKKESVFQEYVQKDLSDDELFTLIEKEPALLERPILISKDKAVIGRPTENILKLL